MLRKNNKGTKKFWNDSFHADARKHGKDEKLNNEMKSKKQKRSLYQKMPSYFFVCSKRQSSSTVSMATTAHEKHVWAMTLKSAICHPVLWNLTTNPITFHDKDNLTKYLILGHSYNLYLGVSNIFTAKNNFI